MQEALLLLVLWDLTRPGSKSKRQRSDIKARCGSKVKKAEFEATVDQLTTQGAIKKSSGGHLSLTPEGELHLAEALRTGKLVFWQVGSGTVVSAKNAQAILDWLSTTGVTALNLSPDSSLAISSYEEFKPVVINTHEFLDREYDYQNLVPIHQLRRTIGDRVARSSFNEWLIQAQADGIFQLEKGDVSDATKDQVNDAIETTVSGLRFFAKRL